MDQQQAANTNTVLLGAIAGAGLMSASSAAATSSFDDGGSHFDSSYTQSSLLSSTSVNSVDYRSIMPDFAETAHVMGADMPALNSSSNFQEMLSNLSLSGSAGVDMPAMSQLPQGSDVPVASQAAEASSFATGDVAMPSLEALMATVGQQGANAQDAGEVAQVLADALAGGGGADIDGLLASLPDGGNAVDALASHAMAGVSTWDMGAFGGFTALHQAFTMETLVLHQDAMVQQA
jgi:hypothetical protein